MADADKPGVFQWLFGGGGPEPLPPLGERDEVIRSDENVQGWLARLNDRMGMTDPWIRAGLRQPDQTGDPVEGMPAPDMWHQPRSDIGSMRLFDGYYNQPQEGRITDTSYAGPQAMNPNMAHFARMAAPQMQGQAMPSAPPQGYSAPSMPVRPPMDPAAMMAARGMPPGMPMPGAMPGAGGMPGMPPGMPGMPPNPMAAKGRGGDSMMAHVTPGEIAVPPQVQTPEVLAALNKAFAAAGANPTSFQAGNPDQKVNPETGVPEFSFFDTLLPIGLGIAGTAIGGPVLGMGLADLGVGATTAGILGGALGGGLGSTAGNLIQGKPFGQAAAMGAGSAIGSGIGGAVGSGASSVNDLFNNFGSGLTPAAQVGPAVSDVTPPINMGTGGAGDAVFGSSPAMANGGVPERSFFDRIGDVNLRRFAGQAVGGAIGSGLAESMFSPPQLKPNLGPGLPPLSQTPGLSNYIGGGSPRLTGPIPQGAPVFPRQGYRPAIDPQFNYFSG